MKKYRSKKMGKSMGCIWRWINLKVIKLFLSRSWKFLLKIMPGSMSNLNQLRKSWMSTILSWWSRINRKNRKHWKCKNKVCRKILMKLFYWLKNTELRIKLLNKRLIFWDFSSIKLKCSRKILHWKILQAI